MTRLVVLASVWLALPGVVWGQPLAPPAVETAPPAPAAPIAAPPAPAPPVPAPPIAAPAVTVTAAPAETVTEGPSTTQETRSVLPGPRRRRLLLPSLQGPVGLFRVIAADVGNPHELRLVLHGEYSNERDFVVRGDHNRHLAGTLAISGTPTRALELYAALVAASNRNDRCAAGSSSCVAEPQRVDPPIIRSFGDVVLGAKLAAPLNGILRLGGDFGMRLYAATDGLAFKGDATSAWLNALGTVDLQRTGLPLAVHLNLGFILDNSRNVEDLSQLGPAMLGSRSVAAFAYGMGRSRVRTAVALDAPLTNLGAAFALEPFVEYHFEVVTASGDDAYAAFSSPTCGAPLTPCRDNRDAHWLTFGLRGQFAGGLALSAGADLGLRSFGFAYGAGQPSVNVVFGLSQTFDFGPPPVRLLTRTITNQKIVTRVAPPTEGYVTGQVTAADGAPVAAALIGPAAGTGRVASDEDGHFVSRALPPGAVELTVVAPGFTTVTVSATVLAGRTTEVRVVLPRETPPPRAATPEAPAPDSAASKLDGGHLPVDAPIGFRVDGATPTAELDPRARTTLDGVARQLAAHPEIRHLRVEAHWDSGVGRGQADELTHAQAAAVVDYLVERGVARERLEAVGRGANQPLVPNLGPASRSKNRRVELVIAN